MAHKGKMQPSFEASEPPPKAGAINQNRLCDQLQTELDKVVELDGAWAKVASWARVGSAYVGVRTLREQRPDMEFTARAVGDGGAVWARLRKAYK